MLYRFKNLPESEQNNIKEIIKNDKKVRVCRNIYLSLWAISIVSLQILALSIAFFLFKEYRTYLLSVSIISACTYFLLTVSNGVYIFAKRFKLTRESFKKNSVKIKNV
jgi:hypothetical protein